MLLGSLIDFAPATMIADATFSSGNIMVSGSKGAKMSAIMWEGALVTQTDDGGGFSFRTAIVPKGCVGRLSDGVRTMDVAIIGCTVAQLLPTISFPPTGETTCWDNGRSVIDCVAQ